MSHCEDRYVCNCEDWTPSRAMFNAIFDAVDLLRESTEAYTWDSDTYELENRMLKARIKELEDRVRWHRTTFNDPEDATEEDLMLWAVLKEDG
jgi:hypothetical protein